jgi:pyruvate dehydrogenase E2 component (dihydrolipoamide acetyltransferase)
MEIEFKMPDLATTDSAIKVIRWLVGPGEPVKRGQPIMEVETDKATMDVESIATGTLKVARAVVGDALVAGQVIAVIETEASAMPAAVSAPSLAAPASAVPPAPAKPAGGMFAKNRAAAAKPASETASAAIALTPSQRTAARRVQESKQNVPHFYLQASVNAEPMIRRRKAKTGAGSEPAAEGGAEIRPVIWDAFFARAAAQALQKFPRLACRFEADQLKPAATADIGVAVDHEGELYVVTLTAPATRSATEISDELRDKVAKLRAGDQEARRLRPAAMTISNLGSTRVEVFAAIISPPEAAILAIGRVTPTAVIENGGVVAQNRVTLTLSVDHRVANGKYAADFLGEILRELEAL